MLAINPSSRASCPMWTKRNLLYELNEVAALEGPSTWRMETIHGYRPGAYNLMRNGCADLSF